MRNPFTSLRFSLFVVIFSLSIIPVLILSTVLLNAFNARTDTLLQDELLNAAHGTSERFHEANLDILRTGRLLAADPTLNTPRADATLATAREAGGLDIATLIYRNGTRISHGDALSFDGFIAFALSTDVPSVSIELIDEQELLSESPILAVDARTRRISSIDTVIAEDDTYQTDGMALVAVIPLEGERALVLADLINRDARLPLLLQETGEVSIYQRDVRIATTKRTDAGNPYIGTLMPSPVAFAVLTGHSFAGRVWDSEWSRAAYLPLRNHAGDIIGALGVSVHEKDYSSSPFFLRGVDISQFVIAITAMMAVVSLIASWLFSAYVSLPLEELIRATRAGKPGAFYQGVRVRSFDEINRLAGHINQLMQDVRAHRESHDVVEERLRKK